MAHLIDKNLVERANPTMLLGILWAALAICVLGALAYDIHYWFEGGGDALRWKPPPHSTTWSARARRVGDTSRPSAIAPWQGTGPSWGGVGISPGRVKR